MRCPPYLEKRLDSEDSLSRHQVPEQEGAQSPGGGGGKGSYPDSNLTQSTKGSRRRMWNWGRGPDMALKTLAVALSELLWEEGS